MRTKKRYTIQNYSRTTHAIVLHEIDGDGFVIKEQILAECDTRERALSIIKDMKKIWLSSVICEKSL